MYLETRFIDKYGNTACRITLRKATEFELEAAFSGARAKVGTHPEYVGFEVSYTPDEYEDEVTS